MSKRLHLICNAHLDPVWQWEWEEGAAETLSTFRIAADFCEEYDSFLFCHNEALLYRWIEEYDMPLFEHIQSLVKRGKWKIMGGWHLQPDCNMPSGEAFVRQILEGRRYFLEKFGVAPTTAVNLDPFGHTRGLVQILAKSGYDGYMFMRPGGDQFLKLPSNEFRWRGYDDSEVTAVRIHGGYNSGKGRAAEKIRNYVNACKEGDFFLCLWGIGNHGGGPSKKDLDDIQVLTAEMASQDVKLIQSCPEEYLTEVNARRNLPTVDYSLNPWSPGCYTSQVRVKQKYRLAENTYFLTESICTHAADAGLIAYPERELAAAMYDILTVQFHDMLPGSSIQLAEELCIRMLDHAIEELSRVKARAFFALAAGQPKAASDRISVFAYNPYPYEIEGDWVSEFMLWDQNWNKEFLQPRVYNEAGEVIPSQCEKEHSTIPLEWRKRVVFHAKLAPMKLNRFDFAFDSIPEKPKPALAHSDSHYIFDNGSLHVEISRSTGLVDKLTKDGVSFLKPSAFALEVWEDNYDPWYMNAAGWFNCIDRFTLLSAEEAAEFCHTDAPLAPVHVIESGDVRCVVEAVFGYKTSRACVKYILSERDGLRVDVRIVWNEKQRMVKLLVPSDIGESVCLGDEAYGREQLFDDLRENIAQKYLALAGDTNALLVTNNGSYGSSFQDGSLHLTLLRSPSYTAHPLPGRVTMPQDRYMPYIEQGERDFSFGFDFGGKDEILTQAGRASALFNTLPMVLSFYPTGVGSLPVSPVTLESDAVQLTAYKPAIHGGGRILRLYNPTDGVRSAKLTCRGVTWKGTLGRFEVKTLRFDGGSVSETDLMEGLLEK
ncbi:MAG: alpha-mannosidase [Clostridia bacterium]|nr:alpha-mannosidase [Clostridia bacterium]